MRRNKLFTILALVSTGIGMLAAAPLAARAPKLTGEQQLAKMLKGWVPGKPVNCINLRDIRNSTIIDKTAIVYDTGSTLYVNRPAYPDELSSDDVLVTKTWGSELCRLDIVQLRQQPGLWFHGSVGLESFVPYTRAAKPAH